MITIRYVEMVDKLFWYQQERVPFVFLVAEDAFHCTGRPHFLASGRGDTLIGANLRKRCTKTGLKNKFKKIKKFMADVLF